MAFSQRENETLSKLQAIALNETRRFLELPACADNLHLAEILALIVIQTSCCQHSEQLPEEPSGKRNKPCMSVKKRKKEIKTARFTEGNPCFMDGIFYAYHEEIFKMFVKHACKKQSIASKSNFGRPLLRLLSHTVQPTEVVTGGEGTVPSQFLWKLKEIVVTEVPEKYSKFSESALLYLSVIDASSSFIRSREKPGAYVALELPCLIEMFGRSSCNNQNNFPAFMSEYIALLHVGLHDDFVGDQFVCKSETKTFDFRVEKAEMNQKKVCKFSVKTINGTTKYFGDVFKSNELTCIDKFVYEYGSGSDSEIIEMPNGCRTGVNAHDSHSRGNNQVSQANIFVYQCESTNCQADPVRKLEFTADDDLSPSIKCGCSCDDFIMDIFQSIQGEIEKNNSKRGECSSKVIIYLVSGCLSNDIRFVVGCKNQFQDRNFPVKDFLVSCLQDHFRDEHGKIQPGFGQENSKPFALLKDRSC